MDAAHRALERLRTSARLADLAARHGLQIVTAFGSVLRPGRASDLDLAVLAAGDLDPLRLVADLEDVGGSADYDVMDLRRASPSARREALGEGLPLFEDRDGRFAELQIAALTEFMETAWLRDLDRELMAR